MQNPEGHREYPHRALANPRAADEGDKPQRDDTEELAGGAVPPTSDGRGGGEDGVGVCPAGYTKTESEQPVEQSRRGVTLLNSHWQWLEEMRSIHSMKTISTFLNRLLAKIIEDSSKND
jgi:hypothetical protein